MKIMKVEKLGLVRERRVEIGVSEVVVAIWEGAR